MSPKKTSLQNQIELEAQVDFTSVDAYPLFLECKDLNVQNDQIECFEKNLLEKLSKLIYLKEVNTSATFQDTIYVDLSIEQDYRIKITGIQLTSNVEKYVPDLDSVLTASVNQLPSVAQPAIKRGIPVKTKFKLPVLITVK